jgi:hypothetical protein
VPRWGTLGRAAGEERLTRRIRIVIGEGRTAQRGLLRFVLEGDGFDVVGEATGSADLSVVIEEKRPDVVVLDDGIGVMAVSMVREVAPDTKVVLVWPSAVVPIGGDARVEPAKILNDLGPAVEHVAAASVGLTETFQRPEWIDRVRKDPVTLREKLGSGEETTTNRPSVARLQRRGRRLHPNRRRPGTAGQAKRDEDVPLPLVVLPGGDTGGELEPVLDIGGTAGTGAVDEEVQERSEWNRRLGSLALSGAAAVSALVLALALGGGRIPVSVIRGGGTLPPGVSGFVRPGSSTDGPFGAGSLGGSGYSPIPVVEPPADTDQGTTIGRIDGGLGGDLATPGSSGGTDGPTTGGTPGDGGTGTDGGGGTDAGGNGGGGDGGGGDGGGGDGGAKQDDGGMPGKSADHNPHGGPPSKLGLTPAHGPGLGVFAHAKPAHAHKH